MEKRDEQFRLRQKKKEMQDHRFEKDKFDYTDSVLRTDTTRRCLVEPPGSTIGEIKFIPIKSAIRILFVTLVSLWDINNQP